MTEYKTIEGHPIEVGKRYEMRKGGNAVFIGVNPNDTSFPLVFSSCFAGDLFSLRENCCEYDDDESVSDIMRPTPEPKPVGEGWLGYCSTTGLVLRGEKNYYDFPDIKLRYDPNKKGVDSITILEVKDDH